MPVCLNAIASVRKEMSILFILLLDLKQLNFRAKITNAKMSQAYCQIFEL